MAESSNISVTGIGPVKPEQAAPLFLMRDPVIFPYSLTPLLVDEENLAALRQTMERDRLLAIFPELPGDEELGVLPLQVTLKLFNYREKRRHSGPGGQGAEFSGRLGADSGPRAQTHFLPCDRNRRRRAVRPVCDLQ